MRLFIALELPAPAVRELVAWRETVLSVKDGLRPVAPESLHVTLAFLGETEPSSLDLLRGVLDSLAGTGSAPLALGSAWWLPRRRPGVLAVAVEDDEGVLREAQGLLASALRRSVGFEPDRRIFFPHVTVARVRRGFKVRASPLDDPPGLEFAGSRVTLYQSSEGYRPLHTVEL